MGDVLGTWSVGVGGFLLGIAVLAMKDWLSAKAKLLLDFLYGRFAGSRLLRRAALAKYTRELYSRHKEFPISFQADEALKLPMESVYVPLRGTGSADDLLAAALRNKPHSVVLGDPGAGKTMLLRHETLMWARRRVRDDRRGVDLGDLRDIPVLFELHRLNKNPELGLEQHLVRHFERHGFPGADKWVAGALARGDLALYFDGLDEIATDLRPGAVEAVREFAEKYSDCRIVVTCRVAVYEGQFAEFHQTLRVQEFDEHLIRRFLGGWPWSAGTADTASDSVDQLLGALRDTPQIMSLARNPLLLTMIAYLYDFVYAGTDQVLPHTRADFYKQVIDSLLMDRRRRSAFPHPLKKAVLRHLALAAQDVPSGTRDRLALPAETVAAKAGAVLERQGRDPALTDDVLREIVERSGLLLAVDNGERYQFAHLTLQEYLAAEFLASDAQGLLSRYRTDPPSWREVVRLWCGAEARDCTEVVRGVFAQDPVLAFQCLADAHTVDDELAEEILGYFRDRLADAGEAEIKAFGLVAADRRRRGREVFGFLRDAADADPGRARAAVRALAATNLPQAAETLAARAVSPEGDAWAALVSMGDLAVPFLEAWVKEGRPEALRALWSVRTPKAALALNAYLWPGPLSPDSMFAAACYLGELLTVPEIAAELRSVELTAGAPYLPWVWRPFAQGPDDALIKIAGRIGLLLIRLADAVPGHLDLPDPDPRITAAVALVADEPNTVNLRYALGGTQLPPETVDTLVEARAARRPYSSPARPHQIFRPDISSYIQSRFIDPQPTLAQDDAAERSQLLAAALDVLAEAGLSKARRELLRRLPEWLRLRAVAALLADGAASPLTWQPLTHEPPRRRLYDLDRSLHYRIILLLCLGLTAVAAWRAAEAATGVRPWGPGWLAWTALAAMAAGWGIFVTRGGLTRSYALGEAVNPVEHSLSLLDLNADSLRTLGRMGLAPAVLCYACVAISEALDVVAATLTLVTVLTTATSLFLRGRLLEDRTLARTHSVRSLVLEPLLASG